MGDLFKRDYKVLYTESWDDGITFHPNSKVVHSTSVHNAELKLNQLYGSGTILKIQAVVTL